MVVEKGSVVSVHSGKAIVEVAGRKKAALISPGVKIDVGDAVMIAFGNIVAKI